MLLLVTSQPCKSAGRDPATDEMQRLQGGEILVETVHARKSGGAAQVSALFHTSMDKIWEIVGFCEHEFVYVRGLEACEVLDTGPSFTKKHHRVNNNWYTPTLDFDFIAIRTSPEHGEFHLLDGDLKIMQGQWNFEQLPGNVGIIVTHEIRVVSKFPAPRWLVRRVLKKGLPNMMACVRGLAGASGDDKRLAGDLRRCPGDRESIH